LRTDTYGLNAVRKDDGEDSGNGWAVGDRGAIVRLGESAPRAGAEPPPADVVPALSERPLEATPGAVGAGSPDPAGGPFADVKSIVMSRDGSEGWAVG